MRILVTGHRGYIGSVLSETLLHTGNAVIGVDSEWFSGCDFAVPDPLIANIAADVRDLGPTDLGSFDAVVHLAGLSDGAAEELGRSWTDAINHLAGVQLAERCRSAGVARFVLASTTDVYGRTALPSDELTRAVPLTIHAESKLRCERDVLKLADGTFAPTVLRLPSAYGVSPRFRLDLPVNEHVAQAVVHGCIKLNTPGHQSRPVLHVKDIASAFDAILRAPIASIHGEVFNVADTKANFSDAAIAEAVVEAMPRVSWSTSLTGAFPPTSVQVTGDKLRRVCPSLHFAWTISRGIRQLHKAMARLGFTPGDMRSDRYRRAPRLRTLLERGHLDEQLRPIYAHVA
jgi:nucleoside-diphosphate-sugar epimerase